MYSNKKKKWKMSFSKSNFKIFSKIPKKYWNKPLCEIISINMFKNNC